jgi:arylsulfatase A-like enzyme
MRRSWKVAVPAVLILLLAACSVGSAPAQTPVKPVSLSSASTVNVLPRSQRPNILLILVDDLDLRLGSLDYMPNLEQLLTSQGLKIEDFFITTPVCCPSRSSILRGQYVHNHQVFTNAAPFGGFGRFFSLQHEASTLATWLQAAGYTTSFFGKYLNGYPLPDKRTYIPPGWTYWYSPARGTPYREFNYYLNENGTLLAYGPGQADYLTDVLSQKADDQLRHNASLAAPFFMYLSTYAPHAPAIPAPRHAGLFPNLQVPRGPSFNEADVTDKIGALSRNPLLDQGSIDDLDELYRNRIRSMQAVDEMIIRLVGTLQETGQLENTYIIFMSDNGFHMGQHRLYAGKGTPYEEDINVPFIIRGPGIAPGSVLSGYLAGNIDIAPTLADLAGVVPPAFVDGRSLVPLWSSSPPAPGEWRKGLLLEYYGSESESSASQLVSSGVPDQLLEPPDPDQLLGTAPLAHYTAIRTPRYLYAEYDDGLVELYDLESDPYELENLGRSAPAQLLQSFSTWLHQLSSCSGTSCRAAEGLGAGQ